MKGLCVNKHTWIMLFNIYTKGMVWKKAFASLYKHALIRLNIWHDHNKRCCYSFSCLWCILCLGLTIIYVMLWQMKLGRLCWYQENRYKKKRFGDFIRQIERNIKRKIRRKDIITLHSNLFCLIESESWF